MENDESKQTVSVETLRALGFSDDLINEALLREQRRLHDVDPPADLYERITRKPGDRMEDGTVYAGISPDTKKPMYTTEADAPLTLRWEESMDYAHIGMMDAHGHRDWRVPTRRELNVLFNNRAAIGGFDERGSEPAGWYWSSEEEASNYADYYARSQRFSDGAQGFNHKDFKSSLRCVRG